MNVRKGAAMLAGLALSAGLAAGVGPVANAADVEWVDGLPTMIVNGDFEAYPLSRFPLADTDAWGRFTAVDTTRGQYFGDGWQWFAVDGWDPDVFGWSSDQTDGQYVEQRAGAVELQRDLDGNTYAELCAYQTGTAIRQTIHTVPGAVYTISLRHASQSSAFDDSMQVLVGPEGAERPVEMTRTTSNGNGDVVGETSDVVATHVSNGLEVGGYSSRDHAGQWETYEGVYVATSDTTVFTFRQVASPSHNTGNLLDDIRFEISWPLTYELNGGSGAIPNEQ